ncbi:hypothetical protein Aduo_000513 [Ancylostoma duodenale]
MTGPHSIPKKPKTKIDESSVGRQPKSLKGFFRRWGAFIGHFPLAFLVLGFNLCSLSCGMVKLHLRDNVRDGYTPHTSRSRVKTDLYREFLGSEGDPAMTTVLMLTKDNGSMHRLDYPKCWISENFPFRASQSCSSSFVSHYAHHRCILTVSVGIHHSRCLLRHCTDSGHYHNVGCHFDLG